MRNNTARSSKTKKIRPDHFDGGNTTYVLYRCFNRRKRLLYVGMTTDPRTRFKTHKTTKLWWKYVDHITLEEFLNRADLVTAEANAIQNEKPQFNIAVPHGHQHNTTRGRTLWPDASTFSVVLRENDSINTTIEQQLYPCSDCGAKAIYCEAETVGCGVCGAIQSFSEWFRRTFDLQSDTPAGTQMTLL